MVEGVFTLLQGSEIELTVNDMPEGAEFENLGTTVEVITQGGTLKVGEKQFELQQFHFHLPSEHLDAGKSQASTSTRAPFHLSIPLPYILLLTHRD
jgi:carbonic anhydrase